jgi:hypothetical protein
VSKEGDGAEQALSSGEQELRLLMDVVIGAVTRIVRIAYALLLPQGGQCADARCGLRAILPAGPVTRCDGQHSGLVRRWR